MNKKVDPKMRFLAKVDKSGGCWLWNAAKDAYGYGKFHLDGEPRLAHRISYQWAVGPIPEGMYVDHICRVVACVNPSHLRLATPKQNQEHRGGQHRGATFNKEKGKWRGQVGHFGKHYSVGYHATEEEAAEAARQLRLSLFTHNYLDRKTA